MPAGWRDLLLALWALNAVGFLIVYFTEAVR